MYIRLCSFVRIYMQMYVGNCACVYVCVRMCARFSVCVREFTYFCVCAYVRICVSVRVYARLCVSVLTWRLRTLFWLCFILNKIA